MEIRINGRLSMNGAVYEEKEGPWQAELSVDEEDADLEPDVTLTMGENTWVGTVLYGSLEAGSYVAHLVGGKGGLRRVLPAKYYYQTTLQTILTDICTESGENLDTDNSETALLTSMVPRFLRVSGEARLALSTAAREGRGFWRIGRNGKVQVRKAEVFRPLTIVYTEEGRDPSQGTVLIAPDEDGYFAAPGDLLGNDKILAVTTLWTGSSLDQTLTVGDESAPKSETAILMDTLRKSQETALTYRALFPGKVVSADGAGTIEIIPDGAVVRGRGLTHVPMRHGLPGLKVKVQPGERCDLLFEEGSPTKPIAGLWADGAKAQELHFVAPSLRLSSSGSPTQSFVRGQDLKAYVDGMIVKIAAGLAAAAGAQTTAGAAFLNAMLAVPPNPDGSPAPAPSDPAAALAAISAPYLSTVIKGE